MLLGYARISTSDQNLDLQVDALQNAGCTKIYSDIISGSKADRTYLKEALGFVRPGDTLIVWRLDRLGRSLKDLIEIVESLDQQGIGFKSLQEAINTTTSGGKLIFHLFGALAEFERNLIRERTMAGLASARARGRLGGRPKTHRDNIELALHLGTTTDKSIKAICEIAKISRGTYYHYLRQKNANLPPAKNPESP